MESIEYSNNKKLLVLVAAILGRWHCTPVTWPVSSGRGLCSYRQCSTRYAVFVVKIQGISVSFSSFLLLLTTYNCFNDHCIPLCMNYGLCQFYGIHQMCYCMLFVPILNNVLIGRRIFTAQRYASTIYAVFMCLSVCLSITSQCSTKTAKRRITQTTPHDSPWTLVFCCQKSWRNSNGVIPYGDAR